MQNRLNPFFREALEEGVVQYCTEHGIGFLAYSPIGGGRAQSQAAARIRCSALWRVGSASPLMRWFSPGCWQGRRRSS